MVEMNVTTTVHPATILELLRVHEESLLELCEELVSMESPSDDPSATRPVLERLGVEFTQIGYRHRLSPPHHSGGYLFARPGRHPRCHPAQLVVGHVDTVWPKGTLATRPWTVAGHTAKGPGVFDMKAGLVQIVFALRTLYELGVDLPASPLVLLNTDEEIGSRESGATIARLARISARAFICEPGMGPNGSLKTARKGIARYTVTVHGKAAHAGLDPDSGVSAIFELSSIIQRLFSLNDRARDITVNVGTIEGGIQPNVIAPSSRAVVDVRVLSDEDAERIDDEIRSIRASTPGAAVTVTGGFGRPPMVRSERNEILFERARRIGATLGMDITGVTAGGGSDGNTTSRYTATLDGLGVIGDGAHAPGERIDITNLVPRTALLAALLMEPLDQRHGGERR